MSGQAITLDMSTAQPIQAAAPVILDMSTAQPLAPAGSVGQRLRENFLQGVGVTNDEGAKNFFEHPISTLMNSLEAQGQLALKAKEAYAKGDYKGALMYGLNYLAPFVGQQTAKAGEQLNEGDIAGGIARTAGAVLPIVAGSPEARAAASNAASAATSAVKVGANAARPVVAAGANTAAAVLDNPIAGMINPRFAHLGKFFGRLADALEKSQQAHADVLDLDATTENIPYAGETARGRKLGGAQQVAQPLQPEAPLQNATQSVVDKAVPPTGDTSELNTFVRAQVDKHLSQGDIASAERVLDTAAKTANPKWQPPARPRIVPSVQNIRERIAQTNAAEAAPDRPTPDALEDRALQQQMNWD